MTDIHRARGDRCGRDEVVPRACGPNEVLAYVAHELRAPLASIAGWTELLQNRELDEHARHALTIIRKNVAVQSRLIDDLLVHQQILHGRLHLDRGRVELMTLAASANDSLRPVAAERNTTLALQGSRVLVHGDAGRLRQVLYNLLTNAIRYSPEGSQVTICVERDERSALIRK